MLEKVIVTDKIEILEDGTIQTREVTRIIEDGEVISQSFTNRKVIEPGDDVTMLGQKVKDVSNAVHTTEVVTEYQAKKAAQIAALKDK